MKKSYNSATDVKNENDVVKRLYRSVTEVARQLDDERSQAQVVCDLFLPTLVTKQCKLKDYCERLIFAQPLLYGRRVEELLWRKAFYDIVNAAKKIAIKDNWSRYEKVLMRMHLGAALGFYQHLLIRLQTEFNMDLRGLVDFPAHLNSDFVFPGKASPPPEVCAEVKEWSRQAVHRCLLYMGDLSRYSAELSPCAINFELTVRYYLQALCIFPRNGMPHNQLGTMAGTRNYCLDAAYHYMRCITSPQPFDGADGNLHRIFDRNAKWLENHTCNGLTDDQEITPVDAIHRFLSRFLSLVDVWFYNKTTELSTHQLCHETLLDLQLCLSYPAPEVASSISAGEEEGSEDGESHGGESDQKKPTHLSEALIFKIVAILLICVARLQESGSPQLSGSLVAFTLAVFSQLVQQVIIHFQDSVFSLPITTATSNKLLSVEKQMNGGTKVVNGNEKANQLMQKLRRRRRRLHNSDSDCSDGGEFLYLDSTSSDEAISDVEEPIVLSSDDGEADEDEEESDENNSMPQVESVEPSSDTQESTGTLHPADVLELVVGEGKLLGAVRVIADWLQGESTTEMLQACGRSNPRTLLSRLVTLLNITRVDVSRLVAEGSGHGLSSAEELYSNVPLPEDIELRALTVLQKLHSQLDWEYLRTRNVKAKQIALLRTCKLAKFGHFLTTIPETGITYDESTKMFNITPDPPIEEEGNGELENGDYKEEWEDEGRRDRQLMKQMGQLWLKAEVRELESRVQRGGTRLSPYLAVDGTALTAHLPKVRHLVASRRFIVLVPAVVVSELDELKREESRAREAIRWLEAQFQRGNRFLRAQRLHERLPLPLIKYPRKKERDAAVFFQVVECCHYFSRQAAGAGAGEQPPVVTLLSGSAVRDENAAFSPVGVAQSAGINLEPIEAFYNKWRTSGKVRS